MSLHTIDLREPDEPDGLDEPTRANLTPERVRALLDPTGSPPASVSVRDAYALASDLDAIAAALRCAADAVVIAHGLADLNR